MAAPTRGRGASTARTVDDWGDRIERAGDRIQEPLREHAETIQRVGRVGWVAKGFVYAALAVLVWQLARQGAPAESADQQGALRELAGSSGGTWLLGLVAVGLALYAMWRLSEAAMATSEGAVDRLGALGSGLLHLALAVLAIRLVLDGEASGEGGGTSTDDRAAGLLGSTGGRLLVGAIGLVLIGMAVEQVRRAWTASFMRKIDSTDFRHERSAIEVLGRAGHAARGVVWAIVGGFLAVAAWQVDRDDAKGLDGSLREVAQHAWGDTLLAVTAIGLAMYALFCVVSSRHQVLTRR
jgi:hypothetical protein